jgi:hypothetical protein
VQRKIIPKQEPKDIKSIKINFILERFLLMLILCSDCLHMDTIVNGNFVNIVVYCDCVETFYDEDKRIANAIAVRVHARIQLSSNDRIGNDFRADD